MGESQNSPVDQLAGTAAQWAHLLDETLQEFNFVLVKR